VCVYVCVCVCGCVFALRSTLGVGLLARGVTFDHESVRFVAGSMACAHVCVFFVL
jgi:hypothetical protein